MEQIMKNNPKCNCPQMTVAVGKVPYYVNIHFNEQIRETLEDKLKRLLIMESQKKTHGN